MEWLAHWTFNPEFKSRSGRTGCFLSHFKFKSFGHTCEKPSLPLASWGF